MTGTSSNNWGDQYKGYVLWIEFESTKSKPLTLVYIAPKYRRGSNNTTQFTNVNYAVTGSAPSSCVKSRTSDAIVTGGTLNLPAGSTMVADTEKCEFKGWYTNPMATEAQKINTDKITVSASNKYTLYAKIDKKTTGLGGASITTSIEGGEISGGASDVDAGPDEGYSVAYNCNDGLKVGSITVNGTALSEADVANHQDGYTFAGINEGENSIAVTCVDAQRGPENDGDADLDTPSVDTFIENGTITEGKEDIEAGASYNVEYSCKKGYHLSYIIVDGEELDKNEYPSSYKFEDITEGRSIAVICSDKDEEADAKAPNTGSIVSGSYGEDGTAGGNLNIAAIIASSLVSVTGIALIYRFVRRSNAYSFKK